MSISAWPLDWEDAFSVFYKPLLSTPFRNNIVSSVRLIMILPCTTVDHKNEVRWHTILMLIWITSHKTTRDTTRAGVNLYLQNGIISCWLKKMLSIIQSSQATFTTPLWNNGASSHRLKMTFYVLRHVPISRLTLNQFSWYFTNFAQNHATNYQFLQKHINVHVMILA